MATIDHVSGEHFAGVSATHQVLRHLQYRERPADYVAVLAGFLRGSDAVEVAQNAANHDNNTAMRELHAALGSIKFKRRAPEEADAVLKNSALQTANGKKLTDRVLGLLK